MAFYKDLEKKTRQQKRTDAFARGGFEEEGYYGKGKRQNGYGEHRGGVKTKGETASWGKPSYGRDDRREDRPYGKPAGKSFGKPAFGRDDRREDRPYGKPAGKSFGKPAFGRDDRREDRPFGKPAFKDRPAYESSRWEAPAPRHEPAPRRDEEPFDRYRHDAPAQYGTPVDEAGDIVPPENLLTGRNPIREALKSGRDIEKLLVARGELSGSAREILAMAKERRVPVQEVDRARLDAITKNHQGMLAFASAYQYSTVETMLANAEERGEEPFLILLDGVTDPHNLGAIIRSAECCGAHGVIVQERRAVGLTPAAVKASAGAVEYMPVARVTNLANTIELLKSRNIWVYAADMDGENYLEADLGGAVALVIGAEGEGVGRRVLDTCDKVVSLPIRGHVDSLNASVAAGILMYAVAAKR